MPAQLATPVQRDRIGLAPGFNGQFDICPASRLPGRRDLALAELNLALFVIW